jgi:hypothetical protein
VWTVDTGWGADVVAFLGPTSNTVTVDCTSSEVVCKGRIQCYYVGFGWDFSIDVATFDAREPLAPNIIEHVYTKEACKSYSWSELIGSVNVIDVSQSGVAISIGTSAFFGRRFCTFDSMYCFP